MPASASVIITLALVFYTIGVWSERIAGRLKPWHLAFFYLGLAFDTVGTGMMFSYADGMTFDVHGITGMLAIVLMLVHAVWGNGRLGETRRRLDHAVPQVQRRGVGRVAGALLQSALLRDGVTP